MSIETIILIKVISYVSSTLAMYPKEQMIIAAAIVLSSFISVVAAASGLTNEVLGQQQNTTITNATSSNQTQGAGLGPMASLTQSDFGELTDSLNSAREALRDDDPAGAIGDLGSAETEVRVFMRQVGGEDSTGGQLLLKVLSNINAAQDASGNNDTMKAFQRINTADTELLKITQELPSGEDEDDD
jgi:hypothetical protein